MGVTNWNIQGTFEGGWWWNSIVVLKVVNEGFKGLKDNKGDMGISAYGRKKEMEFYEM